MRHYERSSRHPYCQRCNEHFSSVDELKQHYRDDHWYCDTCDKVRTLLLIPAKHSLTKPQALNTQKGLQQHNRQKHPYCTICDIVFKSESDLKNHQRTHLPKIHRCTGCEEAFATHSDLIAHWENRACPSGMTRKDVNRVALAKDPGSVITDMLQQGQALPSRTEMARWRSQDGSAYECMLCHRMFSQLLHLKAHLESPRHEAKIYKCPPTYLGCEEQFSTFSGLVQHMESEKCDVHSFKSHEIEEIEGILHALRVEVQKKNRLRQTRSSQ